MNGSRTSRTMPHVAAAEKHASAASLLIPPARNVNIGSSATISAVSMPAAGPPAATPARQAK